jgi:hypothetical protein
MVEKTAELTVAPALRQRLQTLWLQLTQTADTRAMGVTIFLASLVILLAWRLFTQLEIGDSAIWDYVAQAILRGQVPYRDVVEIKGPGSAYLSALAMWLGKWVGVRDVLAVRFMQMLLASVLSVITYLVAEIYLRQRIAALIAVLFPLMSALFVSWVEGGTQPKLTMIFSGMLSLLMIAKERPFWAGVTSMLSGLCWQPGLLFTGVAFLIFSRYLTNWRDAQALKVVAGALLPLSIVLAYFYSVGALTDFWIWIVAYNFNVYAPDGIRSLSDMLAHLRVVALRVFKVDVIWLILALAGFVMFGVERLRARRRGALSSPDLFRDALVIAPLVYLAFCLINFQSGPDFLPLFPFIGIFAGWLITEIAGLLTSSRVVQSKPSVYKWIESLPAAALLLTIMITITRAAIYRMEDWTLWHQERELKIATDLLGPDDEVYVHGTLEILVLTNKPNLNPYILWDHGKIDYIVAKRYGGSMKAMIEEMEAAGPKLVAISRLKRIPQADELEQWVDQRYEKLEVVGYDIYVRKQ